MKKIIIICLLYISSLYAQTYYLISQLKGIEDNNNNTQLFYRLYTFEFDGILDPYKENSIYHFDLLNQSDSLFLFEGGRDEYMAIIDVEIWERDYKRFIYLGEQCMIDCDVFIKRYDNPNPLLTTYGFGSSLELSRQDTNIIFSSFAAGNFKSTNWGITWDTLGGPENSYILSVSPFNHDIIFFFSSPELFKSIDGGSSYFSVDTMGGNPYNFYYDKDSLNIYALHYNPDFFLLVSNSSGESWEKKYSSSNPIFISIDNSLSGSIYLSDGRKIYLSTDYGETFNLFKELDRKIAGIYKKPNSDKLYAATKYQIYEISSTGITVIKQLEINPELFEYYPLAIGNKWIYKTYYFDGMGNYKERFSWEEVISDTTVNEKKYFKILKDYGPFYLIRIDSISGKVYKWEQNRDNEFLLNDLLIDVSESFETEAPGVSYYVLSDEDTATVFNTLTKYKYYEGDGFVSHKFSLAKGFGVISEQSSEAEVAHTSIVGALINGAIYGDTTIVGINDEEKLPNSFKLFQNYPNPFNPTTSIKYSVPSLQFTIIKVYDVLSNEVSTLVNEVKSAGEYEVEFDGSNLSSGIYFYQIKSGSFIQTNKMILVR
jgi:hypothetical protein